MGNSDGTRTGRPSKNCLVKSPESAHVSLSKRKVLVEKCTELEYFVNIAAKYDAKR